MKSFLARAAVLAAIVSVTGCRSAFPPEPVIRMTAQAANVPATTAREVAVRTGPDAAARVLATLPAGTAVSSAEQGSRGFRRVKTADGKTGFVEESALTFGAAPLAEQPAQAPGAQPTAPSSSAPAAASPQG